jgi:undecaprenyl-diphosphatase
MRRVNRWTPPRWMRLWMVAATRGGDGWLWYGIGAAVALDGGPARFRALLAAALAVSVGIALFLSLKRACGRKRPCTLEPHSWATLLPPDQFSFPSGHTITAFAVALSLGAFYPVMLIGLLFCAFSVALSRILLGMHFLSDVLAGAAIGGGLGYAAALLLS